MKLIIQIPCLNEEAVLPQTLSDLPREVEGFSEVEWLVIDDGSSDRTTEVARECGVDHIVRFSSNKGLAVAFQAGLDAALKLGADVIVNTDADNQYCGDDIQALVAPIVAREADVVVGDRVPKEIEDFSRTKKLLQSWGSWAVRQASDTDIPDATSGFRAYTREAALGVNVVSRFTYTLETIIQAGKSNLAVTHVPVRTNPKTRESRLFRSTAHYLWRSVGTILRIYAMHEPLPVFLWPAAVSGLAGLAVFARFFYYYFASGGTGHVQSLIVGAVLLVFAVQFLLLGIISDLLRANRVISERTLERVRKLELALEIEPDGLASTAVDQHNVAEEPISTVPAGRP
ncbi:MAG TPA: glycosyltransferase family 2 protein [Gaiellaceae bacterium]|nr:glycosyltransferase family 2 protein [Gaiellaceae bacterium]